MELLLNLAWLLLVLPAWYLWRGSRTANSGHKFTSLQALLALACVLVILFPVISATDDLHAMRAEIEESPCSKRSVRLADNDRASVWNIRLHAPPALVESLRTFAPEFEFVHQAPGVHFSFPVEPTAVFQGRAPPCYDLA